MECASPRGMEPGTVQLDHAAEVASLGPRVGLDIETTGLDPRADRVVLVALADGERTLLLDPGDPGFRDALLRLFRTRELVVHRATFDLPFLALHYDLPLPSRIWDTKLAERLLTNGLDLDTSLQAAAKRRLGVELDKTLQTSFLEHQGQFSEEQLDYARRDAQVLLPLAQVQESLIRERGLDRIWELERRVLPVFLDIMVRGVPLNREWLIELSQAAQSRAQALSRVLSERLGPLAMREKLRRYQAEVEALEQWARELDRVEEHLYRLWQIGYQELEPKQQDLSNPDAKGRPIGFRRWSKAILQDWRAKNPRPPKPREPEPFDPDSAQQVLWAFQELGYKVESTAEEQLLLLPMRPEHRSQYLEPLLSYRQAAKLHQAFGERWLQYLWDDGMVRPRIDPFGASSGRPTCSAPNLFQLPSRKGPEYRKLVKAPEGFAIVAADYSQMELRIMAELSKDPAMVEAYQRGEDIHLATAKKVFGPQAGERERKVAKNLNFLTLYGGGAKRLAEVCTEGGIALTVQEARKILEDWRREFAAAWAAIESWREQVRSRYEIRTPWGRARYFPLDADPEQCAREGANHVIHNSNADITKLAMVLAQARLAPLGGRLVLQVYDELVALVPQEKAEEGARVLKESMLEAAGLLLREVPVEVDVAWGEDWSCKG